MNELMQAVELRGGSYPFNTIADAAKLAAEGKKNEARSCLFRILDPPNIETRIELWVWSALRELGEQPESKIAWEILGAVVEVRYKVHTTRWVLIRIGPLVI
jgi:hypothetical protein